MVREQATRPVALITGASQGIGLALAKEFARHGYDLVMVSRNEAALQRAALEIGNDAAVNVRTFAVDLSRSDAPAGLFRWAEKAGIQVDVLVNNAGMGDYGLFAESDLDHQASMLQLNILSLTALTRLFVKPMVERGNGRILNVASLVAYFAGGANWTTYVASKSYVLALSRGLAAELRGSGVTVTALSPGATATDFVNSVAVGGTRIYRWLPTLSAKQVARAGFRAAIKGRATVVPGALNKVLAFLGELHPRAVAQGVFSFLSRTASKNEAEQRRVVARTSG